MIGSTMLLAGSYALYMGDQFTLNDTRFRRIFEFSIILVLLTACFGFVSNRTSLPTWHVFAMSASQMLATTSILILGVVAGRRFPDFKLAIYLLCLYYALLQGPAYYAFFVQPVLDCPATAGHPDADFLKGALAGGKIAVVIYVMAIGGALSAGQAKLAGKVLTVVNLVLGIGLALYKISELLGKID